MAAIEILGLEKTYMVGFWRKRPRCALQPLHLAVEQGEIFGFLGPNGAGKTTTLKMLMGLVFPTAGTARILGKEWTDPEVKAQIGFLPEQPYFYDYLTANELLDYYGQLSGVPTSIRKLRIQEVLKQARVSNCGSSPKACSSALASRRPFCTIPDLFFWMSLCRDWIRLDVVTCGI